MFYKLLRLATDKMVFYIIKLLFFFPSLKRLVYPYREIGFKILYPERRNNFFKVFSKGKYRDSQVALIQAPGWGVVTLPLAIASLTAYIRRHNFRVMPVDINVELYRMNEDRYKEGWFVGDDICKFWNNPTTVERFINENKQVLDRYVECILQGGGKVIGFSIYNSSLSMSLYLAKEIKSIAKDRIIVFGGPHASVFMAGNSIIENHPEVDFVVEGEGEETLLEIVQKVLSGVEITECPGAMFRQNGKIVVGPRRELIKNLDSLPFPDFSDFNFYLYREPFRIPISSSRGCVNRCIFCNERPYWRIYRSRSGESMFEEVKYQLTKYLGVFFLAFQDSLVNGNIKALEKFCDLIISSGIQVQWAGQAIIRKEMTYELLTKLKKSGCVSLAYGLETTSASTLEKIGKVFSKGIDIDRFMKDSQKAGVGANLNFMFGLPGETDEEAEENILFLKRNAKLIDTVNPSPGFCSITPGTLAYKNPEKYGIDISNGSDYWVSADGTNTYLKRLERFERFIATAHELGVPCVYMHPKYANKNEAIANYYFAIKEYEKAIPYYEDAIKYEARNQANIDRLEICRKLSQKTYKT